MDGPGDPDRVIDPGLQLERTDLAWARTGAAMVVAAVVYLRGVWTDGPLIFWLPGLAMLGWAVVLMRRSKHTYDARHVHARSGWLEVNRLVPTTAAMMLVFGISALAVIVLEAVTPG